MTELKFTKKQDLPETLLARACGNFVVVKRDYISPSTKSGVIITHAGMKELQKEVATGSVRCVGPGLLTPNGLTPNVPCKGGDRIMWSRYGERIIEEHEDGDLVAVPFQEVVGVLA